MARTGTQLDERRETLRAWTSPKVNGIDRIEVDANDRTVLRVTLVHPAPGQSGGIPSSSAPIKSEHISVTGGDRVRGLKVTDIQISGKVLRLTLNEAGDFSVYHLQIDHVGFDRILRGAAFGFRADCPEVFDPCQSDEQGLSFPGIHLPENLGPPNYLAKDYDSFRGLMLDRLSALSPEWKDREVPDVGLTFVEAMAHYADLLSYRQDVVATESYLGTARRRSSLRRHAALLGYTPYDGESARVFIHLNATATHSFPPSTLAFATGYLSLTDAVVDQSPEETFKMAASGVQVFEPIPITTGPNTPDALSTALPPPVADITISVAQNEMSIHDWGDDRAVLPKNSTHCWLAVALAKITLKRGDYVILQQARHPRTRRPADADKTLRQVVQLISDPIADLDALPVSGVSPTALVRIDWHAADALNFDLPVGRHAAGEDLATALGNVILCDHGVSSGPSAESLGTVPLQIDPDNPGPITSLSDLDTRPTFRPVLQRRNVSIVRPLHRGPELLGARHILSGGGGQLVPAISLLDSEGQTWQPVDSLLNVSDMSRSFVVETETDGGTNIRFASPDSFGLEPKPGLSLAASYRVGRGAVGNIGRDMISHVIAPVGFPASFATNPMPAFGGQAPESNASIRVQAPSSTGQNKRAVIAQDYAARVRSHPQVQQAHVREVWHGSWQTIVVAVDVVGGRPLTPSLRNKLEDYIEPYRLMGQDVRVEAPLFAPIDLGLHVCVAPRHHEVDVLEGVRDALSSRELSDGRLGFFHPDKLGFGEPVYLSRIYEAVYRVAGVTDVKVTRFSRWDQPDQSFLEAGVFRAPTGEIPVLANDPNYPDRGRLQVLQWLAVPETAS